jgi:excisionase family DNA binding protein
VNEPLVTARALADYLGVSADTVLDWAEASKIPHFKLNGRAVRFRPSEVEAWLEGCRRGPSVDRAAPIGVAR